MNSIERIGQLIKQCEEHITIETLAKNIAQKNFWKGRQYGLEAALRIINQSHKNECSGCEHYGGLVPDCLAPSFTICPE